MTRNGFNYINTEMYSCKSSTFSIKLCMDSTNLRFAFSLNVHYLNKRDLNQENRFQRVQLLSRQIKVKHDWEQFVSKI